MRSAKRVIILSAVLVGLLIWPNIVLANGEDVFGTISLPGIFKYPRLEYKGLTQFLTNIVRLLIVAGGLFALFNIILAGYGFMGAGDDPKKMAAASAKIWQSLIGLLLIAGSLVLAALFGWLLFRDATIFLAPKIYGP